MPAQSDVEKAPGNGRAKLDLADATDPGTVLFGPTGDLGAITPTKVQTLVTLQGDIRAGIDATPGGGNAWAIRSNLQLDAHAAAFCGTAVALARPHCGIASTRISLQKRKRSSDELVVGGAKDGTGVFVVVKNERLERHADWVCHHPHFGASTRLKSLLGYLVSRALSDRDQRVTQTDIATHVLGLAQTFDPSSDAHVRIEVGRLRSALELFYARCEEPLRERIVIPKGSYRPEIVTVERGIQPLSSVHPDGPVVLLSEFRANDPIARDFAELVLASALCAVHMYPIVRSGTVSVRTFPAASDEDTLAAARDMAANVVVVGRIYHASGRFRVNFSVICARHSRFLCHRQIDTGEPDGGILSWIDDVAEHIATEIADPIDGTVPNALAERMPQGSVARLMNAWRYMATQDISIVDQALDGLNASIPSDEGSATRLGLLADMRRVSGFLQVKAGPSAAETLDLAYAAVAQDAHDNTAQLALGYALLCAGASSQASRIAETVLCSSPIGSTAADARLLTALTSEDPIAPGDRDAAESLSFYDAIGQALTCLKTGNYASAAEILEGTQKQHIYWVQILKIAAYGELGEKRLATASAHVLERMAPGIKRFAAPAIASFFPASEQRELLIGNLRRAGLSITPDTIGQAG